jgi:hypothetical protein
MSYEWIYGYSLFMVLKKLKKTNKIFKLLIVIRLKLEIIYFFYLKIEIKKFDEKKITFMKPKEKVPRICS